uniref:Adhesion G protein-coupled receptor L4 n=1 Tax=Cyprinus carpio TaxID=7962 RepID=A0A8C2AI12_CYPCA
MSVACTFNDDWISCTTFNLVFSVNYLVEKNDQVEWNRINEDLRKYYITTLLHTAEKETLALSAGYTHTTQMQVDAGEVLITLFSKLYTFEPQRLHKHPVSTNIQGNSISLTPKYSKEENNNGSTSVVFLIYNNIEDLLKTADDPGVADYSRYAAAGEIIVNSPVIAAAISNPKTFALNNVTFTLKHTQVPFDPAHDETKCAFWKYSQSMMGHWSLDGCTCTHVNATHTSCSCNQLTYFTILMSSAQANLLAHYNVLRRITQLGMGISIICLSLCIFTFWFFQDIQDIQNTRTTIHKNLCCSLFMAQFIFLIGINKIAHKVHFSHIINVGSALLIAGLLHYFFLAAFAWKCIEGIYLYLIVVGPCNTHIFFRQCKSTFTLLSHVIKILLRCWLSTENNFIWSFTGPACLNILVNLLLFAVIICKVYRHTTVKKPEISHYENIRPCIRGAVTLLFVLGVTWTFGVMHILHETTLTAYLFTFANVFQGMFIFIFLCTPSRRIQEEYCRLYKNVPCCFECLQ